MINTAISALAWSQIVMPLAVVTALIVFRASISPYVVLGAGVFIAVYFFVVLSSAGWIAEFAGCDRFDEGSTSGCVIGGVDVSSSLYALGMTGWLGMFVLPLAFLVFGAGLILAFGWMGLLKAIGVVFLIAAAIGFIQGLMSGASSP
ncbi:MAG: hypothetical protein AAFQ82_18625 [Myxococcota bacterium]